MRRTPTLLALLALAGSASARKKPAPGVVALRLTVDVAAGADAVEVAARPDGHVALVGRDLVLGPYPSGEAAWAAALPLLRDQPWQPRVIVDAARVVGAAADGGPPYADRALPKAAELATAVGGRLARLLVARAGGYAVPDHELPQGTQEIAVLVAGKRDRSVVVTADREVCDAAKGECLGWFQALAPGPAGSVRLAWFPMNQLYVPGVAALEIRRLGRGPDGFLYDVVSKAGARTYCRVDPAGPQPVHADKGKGHDGSTLYGPDGARVGQCDKYALKPLGEEP